MKKVVVLLVLVVGLTLIGTEGARADTPGCVSQTEYRSVRQGATRARVAAVFDIPGRVVAQSSGGGYAFEIREYRPCRAYSYVSVSFERRPGDVFRLSSKSAFWG